MARCILRSHRRQTTNRHQTTFRPRDLGTVNAVHAVDDATVLKLFKQFLGFTLALLGWLDVILVCGLPMWRKTSYVGSNFVTSQSVWEGIWMNCTVQSTGKMQCTVYDSMLALSMDLQVARALVVISLGFGIVGLRMSFTSHKCNNYVLDKNSKKESDIASGVVLIISGVLCLIPVCWTASTITNDLYNRGLVNGQRHKLGACLYIGWVASFFLVVGGGLLCSSCPRTDDQKQTNKTSTSL
ncbi:claudin-4-like [Astyanax mexicanus]|uniref:claudin-4-like n=1 Tax=Astyanax mexicanus TaxID=7994 RepID=UPI0020CB192F|nr:claudin-4-like [Astyanax mexicanus]